MFPALPLRLVNTSPRFEVRTTIRAPRSFVYEKLADPNGLVRLIRTYTAIDSVKKEGDIEVIEGRIEVMGRRGKAKLRRKYFPPERIEEVASVPGMAEAKQTLTFSESPEGTAVLFATDAQLKGAFAKLLGRFATGKLKRTVEENFQYAKGLLEMEAAA